MSEPGLPPAVADNRDDIAERLTGARGLVVGLDFDGTLAPIAPDPDGPTISPACRRALRRLAVRPDAAVAVISGRALSDLRGRVGVDGIVYAGNHGLELDHASDVTVQPVAERYRPAIRRVADELGDRLSGVPGLEIEDKTLSATVHVRRTPTELVDDVHETVSDVVSVIDGSLRIEPGKQVFEVRPPVDWDKGAAIQRLAAERPEDWRVVYLGDDITDDDAFRAIRPEGVGILVGSRPDSAADYRLPDQASVAPFLHWLVEGVLENQPTARS